MKKHLKVFVALILLITITTGLGIFMCRKTSAANTTHIGEYKIEYNYNGVYPYTNTKWYGAGVYMGIETFVRKGYELKGWKCDDGRTYKPGEVIRVMHNMKLTAIWEKKAKVKIQINRVGKYAMPYDEYKRTINTHFYQPYTTIYVDYNTTLGELYDSVISNNGTQEYEIGILTTYTWSNFPALSSQRFTPCSRGKRITEECKVLFRIVGALTFAFDIKY